MFFFLLLLIPAKSHVSTLVLMTPFFLSDSAPPVTNVVNPFTTVTYDRKILNK